MEHGLARRRGYGMKLREDFPKYDNLSWDYELSRHIDLSIAPKIFMNLTDKILWDIIIRFFRRIGLESLKRGIKYYVRVDAAFSEYMPVYFFHIERESAVDIDDYEVGRAEDKAMYKVFNDLYRDVVSEICVDWDQSHKKFQELSQAVTVIYRSRSFHCMSEEEIERHQKSTPWYKKDLEELEIDLPNEDLEELEEL
jgi:hypothetical protein